LWVELFATNNIRGNMILYNSLLVDVENQVRQYLLRTYNHLSRKLVFTPIDRSVIDKNNPVPAEPFQHNDIQEKEVTPHTEEEPRNESHSPSILLTTKLENLKREKKSQTISQ